MLTYAGNKWYEVHNSTLVLNTHIQILHWFSNVKLVHSGNNDGRRGKEEEEKKEDRVDDEAADPPGESSQRQMLPVGKGLRNS